MNKKNNNEFVYYEHIHLIVNATDPFKDNAKIKEFWFDIPYDEPMTFGEFLEEAKKMGCTKGTILLICESFLSGKIYGYGNYKDDDSWVEVGEMRGFA